MKATAIVPAFNEENNIGNVLQVLVKVDLLGEIIVVDDGSADKTAEISASYGVRVIRLNQNLGKGGAMMKGVQAATFPNLLFLDADLIGLTKEHVVSLLTPVIADECIMTIGIFEKGRFATDLAQFLAPFLSGQRAVKMDLFYKTCDLNATRFGVEVALTKYADDYALMVEEIVLKELTHVMKEEKLGLVKGMAARMKMYWEIAKFVSKDRKNETKAK